MYKNFHSRKCSFPEGFCILGNDFFYNTKGHSIRSSLRSVPFFLYNKASACACSLPQMNDLLQLPVLLGRHAKILFKYFIEIADVRIADLLIFCMPCRLFLYDFILIFFPMKVTGSLLVFFDLTVLISVRKILPFGKT